jgi:hypothetical protein
MGTWGGQRQLWHRYRRWACGGWGGSLNSATACGAIQRRFRDRQGLYGASAPAFCTHALTGRSNTFCLRRCDSVPAAVHRTSIQSRDVPVVRRRSAHVHRASSSFCVHTGLGLCPKLVFSCPPQRFQATDCFAMNPPFRTPVWLPAR